MKRVFVLIAYFLFTFPAVADSFSPDEKALTKMAATLAYGESRCPHLEGNTPSLALMATSRRVSPDDWRKGGRLRGLLEANIQLVKAEFDSTDDKIFCLGLEAAFGPNGVKAPGAMRRK
ncbi:hypothetical protein FM996_17840 [Methylosinus sporium]|uniref:TIGR02301 family protein n=1 Tax=Methylosinus sporium TaxID=428 RepID=A0A549SHI7_METSR|nr:MULTISPECIES: hypothetical protein [Methylosinus]MBU3888920.1 hypothetical protein [Methylosinus sp. KRF6]TRL29042.1 hypothetical protein FM996_17840 [Methylosinus sporium]